MPGEHTVQIGSMSATLKAVRLPFGLIIDELRIESQAAQLDDDPIRLQLGEPARVEARVSEKNLCLFLEEQAPSNMREFAVTLGDGVAQVNAVAVIILPLRVSAVCRFVIKEERQLWVELDSVDVMGVGASSLVENQIAKINPVIDAADLPFPMRLLTVDVRDGFVLLTGTADAPMAV